MKTFSRLVHIITAVSAALVMILATTTASALQLETPHTYAKRYDHVGRETGTISPDPDGSGVLKFPVTRNIYNSKGQPFKIETGELDRWLDETYKPKFWQNHAVLIIFSTKEFVYDSYGRKTQEIVRGQDQAPEALVQYSYDESSRVKCKAVRMNKAVYNMLPASACDQSPPSSFGPDRITSYTYNLYDQVLVEKRGVGTSLRQNYVTNTYSTHKSFTEMGPVLRTQTDANGNKTELQYDTYGRLYRRVYPSKTQLGALNTADYNQYLYDVNGNIRQERKRSGAIFNFVYDANNRMINKDGPGAALDVVYNYDLRGLTLSSVFAPTTGALYPNKGISNLFDGFGNLTRSTNNMGTVARALNYQFDEHGNRKRITHTDDVYFDYQFDNLNRVNNVLEQTASLLTVNYKDIGRRDFIQRTSTGARTGYGFDNAGRLSSFTQDLANTSFDLTNTFVYNPASQIASLTLGNTAYSYTGSENKIGTYVPNGLNQYTSINSVAITYDNNANLRTNGEWTYTYDEENHLISAVASNRSASLKYDPLGRLFETNISGTTVPVTQYLYDGDALVAEYNSSTGALIRRYAHGDQVDEPLVMYNTSAIGATNRRYLHTDHQGSIIIQSNDLGVQQASIAYDAFGIPRTTNTQVDRFGYTGQMWFKELNLNYYKARFYSPHIGRFLQTDPIFYEDQMNMYAYVGNDPVNAIDPTGMQSACAGSSADSCTSGLSDFRSNSQLPPLTVSKGATIGAAAGAAWGMAAASACTVGTGGVCALGSPAIVSGSMVAGAVVGDSLEKLYNAASELSDSDSAEESTTEISGGTIYVDSKGNAIVTPPGGGIRGSPDGKWTQAVDSNGKPTGVRIDGGHKPSTHDDPRALEPHGHVPGVKTIDGKPWLPIKR